MPTATRKKERPPYNPAMLRWAREWCGKTIEEAAKKGRKSEQIEAWERGDKKPTVKQARQLAKFYERPFLEFFREDPPKLSELALVPDFRMHRTAVEPKEERGLKRIQAWAEAQRANALDLFDELGERPPEFLPQLFVSIENDVEKSAIHAREAMSFSIAEQINIPAGQDYKFPSILRQKFESIGVLTLKRSNIGEFNARGICLAEFPLPVVLFANEAPSAQAFTLVHEFAHILLKKSGIISPLERRSIGVKGGIERWCDRFAASFLMPADEIIAHKGPVPRHPASEINDSDVSDIAKRFRVSPHAMLIRLVHIGYVRSSFYWDVKKPQYEEEEKKFKPFGRSRYYGTRYKSAVGDLYTGLVIEAWAAGRITNHNAAEYMGIKNFRHLNAIRDDFEMQ